MAALLLDGRRLAGSLQTAMASEVEQLAREWRPPGLRTYAPAGAHEDLLPYLVRRLMENGANTSFVHLLRDGDTPAEKVAVDPITLVEAQPGPHPRIPLPREMYGDRLNSLGVDLSVTAERNALARLKDAGKPVADATMAQVDAEFVAAKAAQPGWDAKGGAERANILRAMADALETHRDALMILSVTEAGKTWPDAVGEVREAADFCRYYALLAERHFADAEILKGPAGETNALELHGRGVFACISPWNFPLAIFTGQVAAARLINRSLAARDGALVHFIAETGGLNALFVDTSAQREQVLDDVILSAFGSAGQRCSALRILFLPEETADAMIDGLKGAMDALRVSDPHDFATDVGPVTDGDAKQALEKHLVWLKTNATIHKQLTPIGNNPLMFGPVMAEITLAQLPDREVFGPILHVIRYRADDLESCARALAAKGYGLTLGIHTRLQHFIDRVRALVPVGNIYVNRSIIGAVVGVQPFGGEGLSGLPRTRA